MKQTSLKLRCCGLVYKRDTYRRTGRGRSGFEMHYTKQQCTRAATKGDYCWQHAKFGDNCRCKWAEKHMPIKS